MLGALAVAAALACLLSGCSEVGFPAVHDMPGPRADTPLTPEQIKQATDDLTTQRNQLQSTAAATAAPAPQKTSLDPANPSTGTLTAGAEGKP
jgi:hypothetical protein